MDECVRWRQDGHGKNRHAGEGMRGRRRRQPKKRRKVTIGLTLPCYGTFEFKFGS